MAENQDGDNSVSRARAHVSRVGETSRSNENQSQGNSQESIDDDDNELYVISQLGKTQKWLETRKTMLETAVVAAKDDSPVPDDSAKCIEEIYRLSMQLLKVSSQNSVKELLMKRLQLGAELQKNLFGSHTPGPAGDTPKESLVEYTKKQASLVSEILLNDGEIKTMQTELLDLQKQSRDIKVLNRDLMSQLQESQTLQTSMSQQFTDNTAIQRLKKHLEEITDKIVLQRHTLQALVVGSGVNWAADDELMDMVVELGRPLKF